MAGWLSGWSASIVRECFVRFMGVCCVVACVVCVCLSEHVGACTRMFVCLFV